jgi:hypothetical protein
MFASSLPKGLSSPPHLATSRPVRIAAMMMDHYQVGIPSPYMNAPVKWGLAFGISSRPLMPTSTKVLLSKNIQEETAEFEKDLRFSKEDIRLMKLYNMLTIL